MVQAWDHEGFGNCTMHRECEAVCPKEISVNFIARMNREYLLTAFTGLINESESIRRKATAARDAD
jgi:hypothetical protein